MDLALDLVSILRRLPGSVEVSIDGQPKTYGILKVEGKTYEDGGGRLQVLGLSKTLIIADGALVGLFKGSLLVVGRGAYAVKEILPRVDGSLEIQLENA